MYVYSRNLDNRVQFFAIVSSWFCISRNFLSKKFFFLFKYFNRQSFNLYPNAVPNKNDTDTNINKLFSDSCTTIADDRLNSRSAGKPTH